jgi:RNA polymerase sigma-70 factor (ECF subfamily)
MLEDKGESLERRASGSIVQSQVLAAIGRLPDHYRCIIMMRHFQHKDVMEIAVELDKPEGTIKSWLFRARALLKKDLQLAVG